MNIFVLQKKMNIKTGRYGNALASPATTRAHKHNTAQSASPNTMDTTRPARHISDTRIEQPSQDTADKNSPVNMV